MPWNRAGCMNQRRESLGTKSGTDKAITHRILQVAQHYRDWVTETQTKTRANKRSPSNNFYAIYCIKIQKCATTAHKSIFPRAIVVRYAIEY
jgi:hypothetical protein